MLSGETVPPSAETVKFTIPSLSGLPSALSTRTLSESGANSPHRTCWPSPETITMRASPSAVKVTATSRVATPGVVDESLMVAVYVPADTNLGSTKADIVAGAVVESKATASQPLAPAP